MKTPIEVEEIDWQALDFGTVWSECKSEIPKPIRVFYESENEEERLEALSDVWMDALPNHDADRFDPPAPYAMQCLLPMLAHDADPALRYVLRNFMDACEEARIRRQTKESLANAAKTLEVIELGFPQYLRLFQAYSELRVVVSGVLTSFPKRVGEYLALLKSTVRITILAQGRN